MNDGKKKKKKHRTIFVSFRRSLKASGTVQFQFFFFSLELPSSQM